MPYHNFGSSCRVNTSRCQCKCLVFYGIAGSTDLWRGEEVERLLVGRVGLLELVLHEVAAAERGPYLAVLGLDAERALEVVDGLRSGACVRVQEGKGRRVDLRQQQSSITGHGKSSREI